MATIFFFLCFYEQFSINDQFTRCSNPETQTAMFGVTSYFLIGCLHSIKMASNTAAGNLDTGLKKQNC